MISLNDILWGDQLGNPDDGNPGDGTDPGIVPQAMKSTCMTMCCRMDKCNPGTKTPCANGFAECR